MAGFLDKIVQFNPYITQVPVEDYLRVGMQKQGLYNQGVEKVQSYIDSVAGLEIAKDVHKQYLNSSLSKLQDKVKKVAAADFSNNQLVNQIGGASRQIISDPILQNAVSSTMFAKKQMSQMEEDRKSGKLNPANEYDFQSKYAKWLSDGDVKTSFNSNYTPFRDVNKKLLEGFKTLMSDSKITDLPFKMDASGNILRDENGNPQLNEVAIRQQYKGISAKRIQDMMKSILDESDLEQLRISGKYQYRNLPPEAMVGQLANSYDNSLKDLAAARENLVAKKIAAKSEDQEEIQASIEAIDKELASVQQNISDLEKNAESIYQNPDEFKGNKFINDYFRNFISAYSYSETEAKYIPNEYQEYRMKREKLDLDYNKSAYDQSRDQVKDYQWEKEFKLKEKELKLKEEENKKKGADSPIFEGLLETDKLSTYDKLNTEIKSQEDQLIGLNNAAIQSTPTLQSLSPQAANKALEMMYADYLSNGELTKDPFVNKYLENRQALEYDLAINKNLAAQAAEFGKEKSKNAKQQTAISNVEVFAGADNPFVSSKETPAQAQKRVNKEEASKFVNERTNRFLPQYSALDTEEKSRKYWESQVLAKINSGAVGQDAKEIKELAVSGKAKYTLRENPSTKTSEIVVTDGKGKSYAPIPLSAQEAKSQGFGVFSPAIEVKNIIYSNRRNNSITGSTNISGDALGAGFNHKHMPYLKNPAYKNLVRADIEGSDEAGGYVPKVWIKNPNSDNNNKWKLITLSETPITLEDAMQRIQLINDTAIEAELNK